MNDSETSVKNTKGMLSQAFLSQLISEFDDDTVRAIILHGSYARSDAQPPYSDVDLVRITKETPEKTQQKKFLWRDGYLLNLSSRPLSVYKEWLTIPQEAIYRVSTIRDACVLVEKDNSFRTFQQEVLHHWSWEPLQNAANAYAGQLLAELSEVILRTIGAVRFHKTVMLIERMYVHILPTIIEAVGVQKGILATGNAYLNQIQETIGKDSSWTRLSMEVAGVSANKETSLSLKRRGIDALRFYQETVHLLRSHLSAEHMDTIEPLLHMISAYLSKEGLENT